MLFVIQTESNGLCTAKLLPQPDEGKGKKMPVVTLKNASKQLKKDVWIMEFKVSEDDDKTSISTLCKSSTDDFL